MSELVPLGIVDAVVPRGSDICSFFSGSAQRVGVVVAFLAEGIRFGHGCVAVREEPGPGDLVTWLAFPGVVACLYDLERFGAEVVMDTLRACPGVMVDGMIYDIPCYIEPGKFLAARG